MHEGVPVLALGLPQCDAGFYPGLREAPVKEQTPEEPDGGSGAALPGLGEKAAQLPVPSCLGRRAPKEVLCTRTQSSSCAPVAPQLLPGQGLCGGECLFVTPFGPIPRRLASGTVSSPPLASWSLLGFSHEETSRN